MLLERNCEGRVILFQLATSPGFPATNTPKGKCTIYIIYRVVYTVVHSEMHMKCGGALATVRSTNWAIHRWSGRRQTFDEGGPRSPTKHRANERPTVGYQRGSRRRKQRHGFQQNKHTDLCARKLRTISSPATQMPTAEISK